MKQKSREIVGVILAGGRGTRMEPFSRRYPKPILPVCNKPLMQYHLEAMANAGIREVFIVIGHLGYEIARTMGSGTWEGMRINYVEQTQTLGIAHALGQLQTYVKNPFLLFLGDIFFRTNGLSTMLDTFRHQESGSVLVVKEDTPEAIQKNFAVVLDSSNPGRVRRVIEKPRYVQNRLKGCGLYLFDLPIFDAVRRTPRTAMRDEYEITDAIQILIDDGEAVTVATVVDEDINLTTPFDLHHCNMAELNVLGCENIVAESASIHPNAVLTHSIIGPGARINGQGALENCVVFAETTIELQGRTLRNYVITPDTAVDCSQRIVG